MCQEEIKSTEDAIIFAQTMSATDRDSKEYNIWVQTQLKKIASGLGIPYKMIKSRDPVYKKFEGKM